MRFRVRSRSRAKLHSTDPNVLFTEAAPRAGQIRGATRAATESPHIHRAMTS